MILDIFKSNSIRTLHLYYVNFLLIYAWNIFTEIVGLQDKKDPRHVWVL
jgi:hypothetical protein